MTAYFITQCDGLLLQSVTSVITKCKNFITKCDRFYKVQQNSHARVSKCYLEGQHGANMYLVYRYLSDTRGVRVHNDILCRYPGTSTPPPRPPPGLSAYCEHSLRQNHFISGTISFRKSLVNSALGRKCSSGHLDGV